MELCQDSTFISMSLSNSFSPDCIRKTNKKVNLQNLGMTAPNFMPEQDSLVFIRLLFLQYLAFLSWPEAN